MNATSTLVLPQQVLIECVVNIDAAGFTVTPAYFPMDTIRFLLSRKVIAIESFFYNTMGASPNYPQIRVIKASEFNAGALVLLRQQNKSSPAGDWTKNIPLSQMNRMIGGTMSVPSAVDHWRCEPSEFSWGDSYVSFASPLHTQVPITVPFLVTYLLPNQDPEPYMAIKNKQHA